MESYLQKKDKSLKSGVNWIKKITVCLFLFKNLVVCALCDEYQFLRCCPPGGSPPVGHLDAWYPRSAALKAICRSTALARPWNREYLQLHSISIMGVM